MANCLTLQATRFINHPQGTETLGYRLYDGYSQTYDNTLESLPHDDDMAFLSQVLKSNPSDQTFDMLLSAQNTESGMEINGNWYDWDDIKHLFP